MRFVIYGGTRLYDPPDFVLINRCWGLSTIEVEVKDGTGVIISPGAGVTVLSVFDILDDKFLIDLAKDLEAEDPRHRPVDPKHLHRYRTERFIPWDVVADTQMISPDPHSLPMEHWARVEEVIDDNKQARMPRSVTSEVH